MDTSVSTAPLGAICGADQSASEIYFSSLRVVVAPSTAQSDSDADCEQHEWFAAIVRRLQIKDAGYVLSRLTGFLERTCYRYAAGDRSVPGYFIRAVLRSSYGGPFLDEFMRGCTEPWWIELQQARVKAALLDELLKKLKERGVGAA